MAPATEADRVRTWLAALGLGAVLGALILGVGGRLAMRGITLWEERPRLATLPGTLTVVGYGLIFGLAGGALRAVLSVWPVPRVTDRVQRAIFVAVCLVIALILLTPLTLRRLALFPPVVVLYALAFEVSWRRRMTSARVVPEAG